MYLSDAINCIISQIHRQKEYLHYDMQRIHITLSAIYS